MKVYYIYTMEYFSTVKKTKVMLFEDKWMELEKHFDWGNPE